jgi:mannose-1-phosphate guanylyltransferase/mannose-6-phosphate isomerase
MNKTDVQPVILCGGSGTRLWPLSRAGFPKQFLSLTGTESLFQCAALRLLDLRSADLEVGDSIIVSNEGHRFLVAEQMREIGARAKGILLEPVGRNTAPALTLAALAALDGGADPVLVVAAADHAITDQAAFRRAMHCAVREAATGTIVILGIKPDRPATGYGYVQAGRPDRATDVQAFPVERFVEKPDAATAQRYLDQGSYFWNAGMFVLRASVWLQALERFRPDIARQTRTAWDQRVREEYSATPFVRPGTPEFEAVAAESIDYAVMEHCPGSGFPTKMVPLDAGWSDVGAWDAVWDVLRKDDNGNAHHGDVLISGCRNTLVHASSRLVSLVGVENLVVVETPDAVMVADKSRCQDVKAIVKALDDLGRQELTFHRKVHRPWGWYDSIDEGGRFKVKRIQVKPKASLSLQKHHHRAEHWVVVRGTAEITNGEKTILLTENQSTYIPLGEVHRLANPGTIPLEIIEVQSGSYLGEDDIVRLEDTYGRK